MKSPNFHVVHSHYPGFEVIFHTYLVDILYSAPLESRVHFGCIYADENIGLARMRNLGLLRFPARMTIGSIHLPQTLPITVRFILKLYCICLFSWSIDYSIFLRSTRNNLKVYDFIWMHFKIHLYPYFSLWHTQFTSFCCCCLCLCLL